jgi:hypothetical protein
MKDSLTLSRHMLIVLTGQRSAYKLHNTGDLLILSRYVYQVL